MNAYMSRLRQVAMCVAAMLIVVPANGVYVLVRPAVHLGMPGSASPFFTVPTYSGEISSAMLRDDPNWPRTEKMRDGVSVPVNSQPVLRTRPRLTDFVCVIPNAVVSGSVIPPT